MVPKSLYRTAEQLESEENRLWADAIYKSASVFKGAPYEVPHLLHHLYPTFYTLWSPYEVPQLLHTLSGPHPTSSPPFYRLRSPYEYPTFYTLS